MEISTVDITNLNIHTFGSTLDYKERVYLLYDGVHYDVCVFVPKDDTTKEKFGFLFYFCVLFVAKCLEQQEKKVGTKFG